MKKLYIIYLVLATLIISACQSELPDPDTDAVYKSMTKIYELKEDGSVTYQYQHELKYITHFAFNRLYGESFIVYHPEKQILKINESLTTQANGTKVPSPENAYNEVLPRFAAGAPAYNHLREMVVTHPGLELDCVVNFDYELTSQKGYIPFLNENLLLAEGSPIQKLKIVVKVPEGKPLNFKLINVSTEPKISSKKGVTTYTWNFKPLQQISFDRDKPHYNETLPRLMFSTASMQEAVELMVMDNKIPENIITVVNEKLKDAKTDFEKLFVLQKMLATEINEFNIPIQHTGYQNRSFAEIWKTNGATSLEKTFFLAALLNHYNIQATPIFALPKSGFDKNIGLLKEGGHTYLAVDIAKESIIISATSSNAKNDLGYQIKDEVLVDFEGNIVDMNSEKYHTAKHLELKGNLTLTDNGDIKGNAALTLKGAISPYFDLLKDDKNAKAVANKAISGFKATKATLQDWDSEASLINFEVEKKKAAKKQEAYTFLDLQNSDLGLSAMHFHILTEKRTAPMTIGGPLEEIYDLKLQVPSGYVMVMGNIDTTLTTAVGEVKITFNNTPLGIEIYKKLVLNKKAVSVDEYPDFRNLYLLWNNKNFKEIALKKTHK